MDMEWKFQVALRKKEYYINQQGIKKLLLLPLMALAYYCCDSLSVKLGLHIPCSVFDKGLSIVHFGSIAVNGTCVIGKNCRIHEGVDHGSAEIPAAPAPLHFIGVLLYSKLGLPVWPVYLICAALSVLIPELAVWLCRKVKPIGYLAKILLNLT